MAVTRGMFDLASECESPRLAMFRSVDTNTGMANNSAVFGLLVSSLWLLYFYGGTIMNGFGPFKFDSSELPIITLYVLYIPIYIALMRRREDVYKRQAGGSTAAAPSPSGAGTVSARG